MFKAKSEAVKDDFSVLCETTARTIPVLAGYLFMQCTLECIALDFISIMKLKNKQDYESTAMQCLSEAALRDSHALSCTLTDNASTLTQRQPCSQSKFGMLSFAN